MNAKEIAEKRKEAGSFFDKMYQSGTTLHAVANARRENSADPFDGNDVISRFQKHLSKNFEIADKAIKKL